MPSSSTLSFSLSLCLISMYTQSSSSSSIDDHSTLLCHFLLYHHSRSKEAPQIESSPSKTPMRRLQHKTQSYIGEKNNISHCPVAAAISCAKRARLQLKVSHNWNWNVVVTIKVYLFLNSLNCRYSSRIGCPIGCRYCPVDPFIHLGHIIGSLCCSPSFLIENQNHETNQKKKRKP